jgi:hypothetical protein
MAAAVSPSLARPLVPLRRGADQLLLLLPLVVLIVPQGTITRTFFPETAFAAFLVVTALTVFVRSALKGQFLSFPRSKINGPLLLLLAYLLLLNPLLSFVYGNEVQRVVITALPFLLLIVYYLISVERFSVTQTKRLVLAFGLSGVVNSAVVVGNYFVGDTSAVGMRSTVIEGSRTLTLPLIPMTGVLFFSLLLTARHARSVLIFTVLAAVCVVAILMTVTRAMLLAYGVGAVLVLWMLIIGKSDGCQRRRALARLGFFAVAIVFLALPFVAPWLSRLDAGSEGDVATILGRFDEYAAFLEGFFHSPIFGVGLGHLFVYPSAFDLTLSEQGITVAHSHFFFLAGTTGLVGVLLYYTVIGIGIARHWKSSKKVWKEDGTKGYVIGLLGAAVAGLLFTLTSTTFTTLSYNLFLAIFLHSSRLDWSAR